MAEQPQQSDLKFDNMTRQDLKKIEKSMKRPQFMGLLNEYMIQISDPKNKNQYDEYLKQMEREKELPKHMKIVELKPKFCFRTFIFSEKNKKHQMKFFINMCESQYLQKPACEPAPGEDGKIGYSWKVPNSIGKIRYDQDKKGSPCQVVDIAFHPDTYYFAARKDFQEMMINIALDASEKQLGQRKQKLSRDYVILKNVICKGQDGKPALMPIRYIEGKVYNKGQGPNDQPQRDNEGKETKLQREINKQKDEHDKKKKTKQQKKDQEEQKQQQIQEDKKLVVDIQQGVQRPKYSTIYTYPIDYSQFIENPAMSGRKKVPSVFNIEFAIPRVESMDEIAGQTLEINDKKIILKIGQKYFIDLQLEELKIKYTLLTSNAKAKYDKKKKCLRIVIPIDQSVNYHPEPQPEISKTIEQKSGEAQQQHNVIQNQTWKNKVLDFAEPSVSMMILQNQQQKSSAPKLVEEIEQQDQINESQQNTANDEDETYERQKKIEKFSISNYYDKKQNKDELSQRIPYLFQQTSDKILLVFQMKNYKKEEIRTSIRQNQEYLIEWNKNIGDQQKINLISFQHLKIKLEFAIKITKVEIIQRVGFVAFSITKSLVEKGKYWEKQIIEQVTYQQGQQGYKIFKYNLENSLQVEREHLQAKDLRQQSKVEKDKKAISISEVNKIQRQQIKQPQQLEKSPQIQAPVNQSKPQQVIFSGLQPQFITFKAPFIEVLD